MTHPRTPAAARPHVLLLMSEGTFDLQFHAEQIDRLRDLAVVGEPGAARRPGRPAGSCPARRGRRHRHVVGCTADHVGAPRRRSAPAGHPARRRHRPRPGARRGLGAGDRRDVGRRRERPTGGRVHARGDHPGRQARALPRRRGPHPSRRLVVRRRARPPEQPRPHHRHRRLVPHRSPHRRAARRPGDRRRARRRPHDHRRRPGRARVRSWSTCPSSCAAATSSACTPRPCRRPATSSAPTSWRSCPTARP